MDGDVKEVIHIYVCKNTAHIVRVVCISKRKIHIRKYNKYLVCFNTVKLDLTSDPSTCDVTSLERFGTMNLCHIHCCRHIYTHKMELCTSDFPIESDLVECLYIDCLYIVMEYNIKCKQYEVAIFES